VITAFSAVLCASIRSSAVLVSSTDEIRPDRSSCTLATILSAVPGRRTDGGMDLLPHAVDGRVSASMMIRSHTGTVVPVASPAA
jgi:hypothetical protein